MPRPYAQDKIIDVTKSSAAFVNKNVLLPYNALWTGPKIEREPIQKSIMTADKPFEKSEPPILDVTLLNLPSKSKNVPIIVPIAIETINKTGYLLFGREDEKVATPRQKAQSPIALKSAFWYSSFIPFFVIEPIVQPVIIEIVFTIVPNI